MTTKELHEQRLIDAACDFVQAKEIELAAWDQVTYATLEKKQAEAEYNEADPKPYLDATKKAKKAWDQINKFALKKEVAWEKLVDAKNQYDLGMYDLNL